ncbi:threonine/serine exporter family protein, partial [Fannyhessea vaginae]
GLLASVVRKKIGYPRIALTVPSIVIMVPGLYMYRAMYNFGAFSLDKGSLWLLRAVLIVFCLPLGLIVARILTDPKWRHAG